MKRYKAYMILATITSAMHVKDLIDKTFTFYDSIMFGFTLCGFLYSFWKVYVQDKENKKCKHVD